MFLINDDFEDELLEPVGGHEKVSLVSSLISPGVLYPPSRQN